jgi:hypothetical protein
MGCEVSRCHKPASFLENMSPGVKTANPQLFCPTKPERVEGRSIPVQGGDQGRTAGKIKRSAKQMNKTECHYLDNVLRGKDARYEALTFRMSNQHRYTPDFVVFEAGRPIECHEVKGGYALHSQQRARLAFDQCSKEFPGLRWIWAAKHKDGWRVG